MSSIAGPADGPVAVTGAAGFIGSHVTRNLVEAGYQVRACVRDAGRADKTSHLREIGAAGPGSIELLSVDLMDAINGSYDKAFADCSAVFHLAADLGSDSSYDTPTAERVYASLMDMTEGVFESVRKAGTVKRVIYTSSVVAVIGPGLRDRPRNYIFTEDDWAGGSYETLDERYTWKNEAGDMVNHWTVEAQAYAKGKVDAERLAYDFGAKHGIDVISVLPSMVLGPLMVKAHNSAWQQSIGLMLSGAKDFRGRDYVWNIVDVRDIAQAQRLAAESNTATNGTRYLLAAWDESGELSSRILIDSLCELYPNINVAGGHLPKPAKLRSRVRCAKAIEELGLETHDVRDTLKATGDSLIKLSAIEPAYKARSGKEE
jgi:nucleoside-diphosphate-sugar epimerase